MQLMRRRMNTEGCVNYSGMVFSKLPEGRGTVTKEPTALYPGTVHMAAYILQCVQPLIQSLAALSSRRVGPLKCGGISNDHIS